MVEVVVDFVDGAGVAGVLFFCLFCIRPLSSVKSTMSSSTEKNFGYPLSWPIFDAEILLGWSTFSFWDFCGIESPGCRNSLKCSEFLR